MIAAKSQLLRYKDHGSNWKITGNLMASTRCNLYVQSEHNEVNSVYLYLNENSIENHISLVGNILTKREQQGYNWNKPW